MKSKGADETSVSLNFPQKLTYKDPMIGKAEYPRRFKKLNRSSHIIGKRLMKIFVSLNIELSCAYKMEQDTMKCLMLEWKFIY